MDWYTERLNAAYSLNEEEWPNFFTLSDDSLLSTYCWIAEHPPVDANDNMIHQWNKRLFALWHEIETRRLYHVTEPEQGTFVWPWEIEQVPVFKTLTEELDWTLRQHIGGSATYHNLQAPPGRRRKIGFNNTPDEENMGLYRRERKE